MPSGNQSLGQSYPVLIEAERSPPAVVDSAYLLPFSDAHHRVKILIAWFLFVG
jgi:hypothetical protein